MTNYVAISYNKYELLVKTAEKHICAADSELRERLRAEKERIMSTERQFFGLLKWHESTFQKKLSWWNTTGIEYLRLEEKKGRLWDDARRITRMDEMLSGEHLVSCMFYMIQDADMAVLIKYQTQQIL
jgi:hypothetical protein